MQRPAPGLRIFILFYRPQQLHFRWWSRKSVRLRHRAQRGAETPVRETKCENPATTASRILEWKKIVDSRKRLNLQRFSFSENNLLEGKKCLDPIILVWWSQPSMSSLEARVPKVRPIHNESFPWKGVSSRGPLPVAFHVTNALPEEFLRQLDELRSSVPIDNSRPTCPRRFFQEWANNDDPGNADATWGTVAHHYENGWVTRGLAACLKVWMNVAGEDFLGGRTLAPLPWFRFLEYGSGGRMDRHTDGSNAHPADPGSRSVATMLVYLSTCSDGGGGTSLHRKLAKKNGAPSLNTDCDDLIEVVVPSRNSVLIFPHAWPHAGCEVKEDPKIALRAELFFSASSAAAGSELSLQLDP